MVLGFWGFFLRGIYLFGFCCLSFFVGLFFFGGGVREDVPSTQLTDDN